MRRLSLFLLSFHALYEFPSGYVSPRNPLALEHDASCILDKLLLVLTRCVDWGCVGLLSWAGLCVGE
jgi:hypothetical protein